MRLGDDWPALVAERGYIGDAARLLGEGLLSVPLLLALLREAARLTLQINRAGALQLFVVQGDADLALRGTVKLDTLDGALGTVQGRLVATLQPGGSDQEYQGIVDLDGDGMEDWLAAYFRQSEGLALRFRLQADAGSAVGLLLQDGEASADWPALCERISGAALQAEPGPWLSDLLGADIRLVEDERRVQLRCDCSHERVSLLLVSLDPEEMESLITEEGSVQAECGFCGATYSYTPVEIRDLIEAASAEPPGHRRH